MLEENCQTAAIELSADDLDAAPQPIGDRY